MSVQKSKHKYLEEIGIKYECEHNDDPKFDEETREIGFPSWEIWDLDCMFVKWVYERCRAYVDIAGKIVDLDYDRRIEYNDKRYTQLELINLLLTECENFFKPEDDDCDIIMYDSSKVCSIWAVLCPMMWY